MKTLREELDHLDRREGERRVSSASSSEGWSFVKDWLLLLGLIGGLVLLGWGIVKTGQASVRRDEAAQLRFWQHVSDQINACEKAGGFPIMTWGTYRRSEGPVYSGCMPRGAR